MNLKICRSPKIAIVGGTRFTSDEASNTRTNRKKGRSKGVAIVVNSLFESAKNGNLGAQCFFLKNTAGWTDRQDLAVAGKDGGPLQVVVGKLESRF